MGGEYRGLISVRDALLRVQVRGRRHRGDVRGGALRCGPELGDVHVDGGVRGLLLAEHRPGVVFVHEIQHVAVAIYEIVEVIDVHAARQARADDGATTSRICAPAVRVGLRSVLRAC